MVKIMALEWVQRQIQDLVVERYNKKMEMNWGILYI
jgi:hypothetical protein